MYTIKKEFHFSASHVLIGLDKDHPCGRLHGHNYVVIVTLQSNELDSIGFVYDYGKLKPIGKYIDSHLDHKHLNDVFDFNPTAENMAAHLFKLFSKMFPYLVEVTVKETPKTEATYKHKL